MKKAQGLKTLGDYRRAARKSLFSIYLPPKSKSTSTYDAIKTALEHSKTIISFSRSNFTERDWWDGCCYSGTKYKMINPTLFDCIKLMEFAIKYHEKSIYELYPNWPKHADPNIEFFSFIGYSYLEVGFNIVCQQGSDIIDIFQNAYLDYNKEIKIRHTPSYIFLNKTPEVDDLKINPEPDKIIKTWFDDMLKGMKSEFPESEYSRHRVKTEFNSIEKQLENEWNAWKEPQESETEYSLPLSMKKWSSILGFSENKMKEIREAGDKYHFDKVSDRKWRLPKNELPAEYLEKYRSITKSKPQ